MPDSFSRSLPDVLTDIDNAVCYQSQALAVIGLWLGCLSEDEESEATRLAAICTLLHKTLSHLKKAAAVNGE